MTWLNSFRKLSLAIVVAFASSSSFPRVLAQAPAAPLGTVSERWHLDQLGYLPDLAKVAVLSDPQSGYNSAAAYTPAATIQLLEVGTNAIVWTGSPQAWKSGATHDQSGDRAWWLDFSHFTQPRHYYFYDPQAQLRSPAFRIDPRAYDQALRQATRMFFYQRRGFAKTPPFADPRWADAASHLRADQDIAARLVTDPNNASTARDLRGGWFDAGDLNKYVTFTTTTLADLLAAYRHNPGIWTDDFGLPESGNNIPDLLDEIRWELDWLLRMQSPDGSVLSKMGVTEFQSASPASADTAPVYYGAASTSATLSAACSFAHAALAYNQAGETAYAQTLQTAALAAWNWALANPSVIYTNTGFSSANPEVSDYDRFALRLSAACYLYKLTGLPEFKSHVEANYLNAHPIVWYYWYAFEPAVQLALLEYAASPGVSASVANTIRDRKKISLDGTEFRQAVNAQTDAYRAYMKDADYVWGSNQAKSQVGLLYALHNHFAIDPAENAFHRNIAADYLHYLHGTNPQSLVYLTNMDAFGTTRSVNQMYHVWFKDGTDWDHAKLSPKGPPPGYLVGGPNKDYSTHPAYTGPTLAPPLYQPVQKVFLDWNSADYREQSWQITEPAIYYQAAYINPLSRFVSPPSTLSPYAIWATDPANFPVNTPEADRLPAANPDRDDLNNFLEYAFGSKPNDSASTATPTPATANGYLKISYLRARADLTYMVERSTDLITWTSDGVTQASSPVGQPATASVPYDPTITPRLFLRLIVSQP